MIVVTQGHEKGIGLEVFFKALALAPSTWTPQCTLAADKKTVSAHLKKLQLPGVVTNEGIDLPTGLLKASWLSSSKLPQSTRAMEAAFELVDNSKNVLFTLPTTKDDLRDPKKVSKRYLGHTEYLRARYHTPELGMFFASPRLNTLLLTDHVALKDVSKQLTPKLFKSKMQESLSALRVLEPELKRALVAGMNPHAGEGGLLGIEEKKLMPALKAIKVKGFKVEGFFPGDSLHTQKQSGADLLVYLHHDQGLAPFKSLMGTLGANVTLGLPYPRLSVDHGTAFALYGKNISDPRGALFCLRKAMIYQERFGGKNSNHKGTSSQS